MQGQSGNFWNWYFIPQIVAFVIFFVASIAELNRAPFDLAEAEQELVAGHLTEYSGMRWGLFMFGEYVNMVVMSAIIATLFFGGYKAPFTLLELRARFRLAARPRSCSSSSCTCGSAGRFLATATTN